MYYALGIALGSLLTEGTTLAIAYREVRRKSKEKGFDSIKSYLLSGTGDPSTSVVLLEDSAAVLGIFVAGAGISASYLTGTSWPDTLGSLVISGILGVVAAFIIRTNTDILLGKLVNDIVFDLFPFYSSSLHALAYYCVCFLSTIYR